jgi:hypothetical protein
MLGILKADEITAEIAKNAEGAESVRKFTVIYSNLP